MTLLEILLWPIGILLGFLILVLLLVWADAEKIFNHFNGG
jgi:nitrogen fixation-related uncharacterized protein